MERDHKPAQGAKPEWKSAPVAGRSWAAARSKAPAVLRRRPRFRTRRPSRAADPSPRRRPGPGVGQVPAWPVSGGAASASRSASGHRLPGPPMSTRRECGPRPTNQVLFVEPPEQEAQHRTNAGLPRGWIRSSSDPSHEVGASHVLANSPDGRTDHTTSGVDPLSRFT